MSAADPQRGDVRIEVRNPDAPVHVLCTAPLHFLPDIRDRLERRWKVTYAFGARRDTVARLVGAAHALVTDPGARYPIDRAMLEAASNLKLIVTPSTGSDHIDLDYCEERGIAVASLRGRDEIIENIHASAEYSFALLLAMLRRLPAACAAAEQGHWREIEDEFRGIELNGKRLGLVGYGRIGRKMADYALAFGAVVTVFDPYQTVGRADIAAAPSIDALLADSQIVGLHVHLDKGTAGMFGAKQFGTMPKGSYFLNTARGGLVDEDALIDALESGHLSAAAVDVIGGERSDDLRSHKLIAYARGHANLLVSPHIAGLTVDSQRKAAQFAADVLAEVLS